MSILNFIALNLPVELIIVITALVVYDIKRQYGNCRQIRPFPPLQFTP